VSQKCGALLTSLLSGFGIDEGQETQDKGLMTSRDSIMTITVDATYENGVLKPAKPLPLKEHEQVKIFIETPADGQKAGDVVQRSYGIIGWKGTHEELEQLLDEAEELEDVR
jgi:predicted DNA-binding antitoxin AbrB/MazE fold protein